ncbi:hypothetical protein HYT24_00235 [Candidatus Pacearchaeota archaeon]|nr:hypothetical protein [Candidatus Pacearchaeota archaeon]
MKKVVFMFLFAIVFISSVFAEITINEQPSEIYNLGDTINLPITITTSSGIYDYLHLVLICDGKIKEVSKDFIQVPANEAARIEKSIPLMKKLIDDLKGNCQIKAYLEAVPTEYVFTNKFTISKSLSVVVDTNQTTYNPEEKIIISGTATKANGQPVNGFVEVTMTTFNGNQTYNDIVNNGFFSINFSMPKNTKSAQYLVKVNVYEKDPLNEISNTGFSDFNIHVKQIPTSLGVLFDTTEIQPGSAMKVKAVLYDQTGEKIPSTAIITVKNKENKIFSQKEIATDELFEFQISSIEPPSEWYVVAVSNQLITESKFNVAVKEDVKMEILNRTVVMSNMGNIPYNKTVLVKIGENATNVDVFLEVNESKKYVLSAPDGEYDVEVIANGLETASGKVALTGNAVSVKELTGMGVITKYPLAWFFLIFVLGFVSFIIFRKGYKKNFFGYVIPRREKRASTLVIPSTASPGHFVETVNKAELSLSLKGENQPVTIVCLKIKNAEKMDKKNESVKDLFSKINTIAQESKAVVYENQNFLMLLFVPMITKTFKNEMSSINAANDIANQIAEHNKLFRNKMEHGIGIGKGDVVAKKEDGVLKFMSLGNTMTDVKKVSGLSNGEVCLAEGIKDSLVSELKTEKHSQNGVNYYTVKEIKNRDQHGPFIKEFLRRIDK